MKILQFFYENPPKIKEIFGRKIRLGRENFLIKGTKACGKKAFVCDYLKEFKQDEFLFLDFYDLRFDLHSLESLKDFLQDKKIKILIFYGIDENFTFDFSLFKDYQILLLSEFKTLHFPNFKELELDFLDFEEFLSISKNTPNHTKVGTFLQHGRSFYGEDLSLYLRANFSKLELEILKFVACNLGKEFSINALYLHLKTMMKISKDSTYKNVDELEKRYILHFIHHKKKQLKRVYFRDFALKNALSIQRDFKNIFANLILSELFKYEEVVYFSKVFDFYIKDKKIAFIPSAFQDKDLFALRVQKILPKALEEQIFHVVFISLSSENVIFEQGIKFELIPFDVWALSF